MLYSCTHMATVGVKTQRDDCLHIGVSEKLLDWYSSTSSLLTAYQHFKCHFSVIGTAAVPRS